MSDRARRLIVTAAILAIGVAAAGAIRLKYDSDLRNARNRFLAERAEETRRVAGDVEQVLQELYRNLRTIARLPGVRSIDRYARGFNEIERKVVQEIYNNAATSVALSEVYIVPLDLDPDAIDPHTGKLQEPITTFDELIVGRHAGSSRTSRHEDNTPALQEVEIFEYRLMKNQLAFFRDNYPTSDHVQGLKYPLISGPEVVTCDNTRFDPYAPDDRARSGLVYSVPFYGPDETLKGAISGVVLSYALQELLPSQDYALINPDYNYLLRAVSNGRVAPADEWLIRGKPDPHVIYSEVVNLQLDDDGGKWAIWSRASDSAFWSRPDVVAADHAAVIGYTSIFVLTLGALIVAMLSSKNRRLIEERNQELERCVLERNEALVGCEIRSIDLKSARDAAEAAAAAKSRFLANVSHELRTPLHCILSVASLGRKRHALSSPEKVQEYFSRIHSSGNTLLELVNNLLDLAKLQSGKMEFDMSNVEPSTLLRAVMDEFTAQLTERGLKIQLEEDDGAAEILADPERLKQVFRNLISNAVKFSPSRGMIQLRISYSPSHVLISVRDQGPGIPEGELEAVFDKFVQSTATKTNAGGTGLGLAICREIVDSHGGRVWARNRSEGGAELLVELPRTKPLEPVATGPA
ncbi:MAG: sensor histidine kinase [Myxococcota bacterium]